MGHEHLPGEDPENSAVGGFIRSRRDRDGSPSVRLIRPEDLSKPSPGRGVAKASNEAHRDQSRATKGHARAYPLVSEGRKRKTKLAVMGISSAILDEGDPDYARCVRLAAQYRKARARELAVSHEFVSSGVSSLLATASLALAASRYLYEKASRGGENMLAMLKTAQAMADSARQNELAAWELAAREAVAKKKAQANASGVPWVVNYDEQKPKPGPKPKSLRADMIVPALPPVGSNLEGWVQSATIEGEEAVRFRGTRGSEVTDAGLGTGSKGSSAELQQKAGGGSS